MKTDVYKLEKDKKGSVTLDDAVFDVSWNNDLVYQAITTHRANNRQKIAHTKGTSEVRGGGRKPWRQKGTGRARHGTIRSPIWKGGGVTFGPRTEKKFSKKINKKMKRKALFMTLSQKLREDEVIFVESLNIEDSKTKKAQEVINNISKKVKGIENNSILFIPENDNKKFAKAIKNISNASAIRPESVNVYDILSYKYLIFDRNSVKELENHFKINKK